MEVNAWDHWLLLRPLIVFLFGCPLLILAIFVGWYQHRRDAKRARETASSPAPAAKKDSIRPQYEVSRSASQTPREWRVRPSGDRRVA